MADWIKVGQLSDIPALGARVVETAGGPVAVFRTADDQLFALHDTCPHKQGPLSEGIVHGIQVTCPLHNWVIDLPTGEAVAPDRGRTACFAVKIEDGLVWLQKDEVLAQ
jgi:nitrite reductase (NADH) small subunit